MLDENQNHVLNVLSNNQENLLKGYGGKKERALYCEKRVRDYLAGRVDRLEELEEERLHREPAAWGGIVDPY